MIPYEVTIRTGDVDDAGCDCDISLKLFGTNGSSSDHIIQKDEGNFDRAAIDTFRCELDDVGKPIKLRVTIIPKNRRGRNKWNLSSVELVKQIPHERPKTYYFGLNDWISKETDFHRDLPLSERGQVLVNQTTYRVTAKTSDIDGAGSDSNVFIVIKGMKQNNISDRIHFSCIIR